MVRGKNFNSNKKRGKADRSSQQFHFKLIVIFTVRKQAVIRHAAFFQIHLKGCLISVCLMKAIASLGDLFIT